MSLFSDDWFITILLCQVSSSDATIRLTLERDLAYEINAYVQTPFDARPYLAGTFILARNIQVNKMFTEPKYQKLVVKESPYIFAPNWAECISSTFVYISFFKNSNYRVGHKNISYLVTELGWVFDLNTRLFAATLIRFHS